jgi:hypothetical protein
MARGNAIGALLRYQDRPVVRGRRDCRSIGIRQSLLPEAPLQRFGRRNTSACLESETGGATIRPTFACNTLPSEHRRDQ